MPVTELVSTDSTNAQNVQYIIENLELIVGTTLGFNLEYEIKDDPEVETTAAAIILYDGETFEESFGEKPLYNEISFIIRVKYRRSDPTQIRDKGADYVHLLREGITIDLLNVGALASTQIVSRVSHDGADLSISLPIIELDYSISVRYREKPSC